MNFTKSSAFYKALFIVFIGLFCSANKVIAASFSTEAEVLIPLSWLHKTLTPTSPSPISRHEFSIDSMELNIQSMPLRLPPIKGQVVLKMAPWSQREGHGHVQSFLESEKIELQMEMAPLSIHQQINQRVNGVNIIVQVDVECSQLVLKQNFSKVKAQVLWQNEGQKLAGHLEALDLSWPANSWQMSEFTCHGPRGITEYIKNEIQQQLANPTALAPIVKEKMQTLLTLQLQKIHEQAERLQPVSSLETVQYRIQGLKTLSAEGLIYSLGVQVDSLTSTLTSNLTSNSEVASTKNSQAPSLVGFPKNLKSPALYIDKENFEKLLAAALSSKSTQFSLSDISAFHRLMRSRFLQFFLWPDLMNFPKHTAFQWLAKAAKPPQIKFTRADELNLSMTVDSWMIGERDQVKWNYLFLLSEVSLNAKLSFTKGQLVLNSEVQSFENKYSFGPEYKSRYNPRNYISISTLESAVQKSILQGQKIVPIPSFKLSSGLSINLESMKALGSQGLLIQSAQ